MHNLWPKPLDNIKFTFSFSNFRATVVWFIILIHFIWLHSSFFYIRVRVRSLSNAKALYDRIYSVSKGKNAQNGKKEVCFETSKWVSIHLNASMANRTRRWLRLNIHYTVKLSWDNSNSTQKKNLTNLLLNQTKFFLTTFIFSFLISMDKEAIL